MAAACTGQLTLGAAIAHKDICLQVAMQAGLEARGRHLGVLYDKLCRCAFVIHAISKRASFARMCIFDRKAWAERSTCGDVTFSIEKVPFSLDEVALRTAKQAHDEAKVCKPFDTKGKGKGKQGLYDLSLPSALHVRLL